MATEIKDVAGEGAGFATPLRLANKAKTGLSRAVVEEISYQKGEPDWMRQRRLKAYEIFESKPMPTWGPDLSKLRFDEITFYTPPGAKRANRWEDVPADIRRIYDGIGIPQAEQKYLAGVVAVYDQEPVYENLKKRFADMGIIFTSMDTAVKEYPDLVKEYFMNRCVPP